MAGQGGGAGSVETRRWFFALWPDAAVRRELVRSTRPAVGQSRGRPVPPHNYHLTLAFLGNQPAALLGELIAAAATVAMPPVRVVLERYGYFARPRVWWIGPRDCPRELARVAADLWDRCAPLGIERDIKPLCPHVTLARKVPVSPEVSRPRPLIWNASRFALVESVPGHPYKVVQEFPPGSRGEPNRP